MRANEINGFSQKAAEVLSARSSNGLIRFLQFKMGENNERDAVGSLTFCIAAVSNSYVVSSSVAEYVVTTLFKWTCVKNVSNSHTHIEIIHCVVWWIMAGKWKLIGYVTYLYIMVLWILQYK